MHLTLSNESISSCILPPDTTISPHIITIGQIYNGITIIRSIMRPLLFIT
jgi:hypothetical protein